MRRFNPVEGEFLPRMSPTQIERYIRSPEHDALERIEAAKELADYYNVPLGVSVPEGFQTDDPRIEDVIDVEGRTTAVVAPLHDGR